MFDPLRWLTLHPALVHLPLGLLPLAALAYVLGATRRSPQWTFTADVALLCAAASTVLVAAFGLLAYLAVPWPGGLGQWPVAHLVLGAATTLLVLALGLLRARARRRSTVAGPRWAAAATAVTLLAIGTGWVGGEVLVFHGGIAVKAAGLGALAPPVSWPTQPPRDVTDAMGRLRASYASATSALSMSLVERPDPQRFASIAQDARHIQEVTAWLVFRGAKPSEPGPGVGGGGTGPERPAPEERGGHGHDAHGHDDGRGETHEAHGHGHGGSGSPGEHMRQMARELLAPAERLEDAALRQSLPDVARALGETGQQCASCHEHVRWGDE